METRSSIEISASSIEKAIAEGLEQLGVSRDQVRVEIIDEGSRGFLGLGARPARIRLHLLAEPKKAEKSPKGGVREEKKKKRPVAAPTATAVVERRQEIASTAREVSQVARNVLSELLQKMGVQASVRIRSAPPNGPVVLDVHGRDLGILIGRGAKTLNALQMITQLIVNREVGAKARVLVDVERYRQRQERRLCEMARRLADQVARTGQPVALEPMPAYERRIIHMALRDHPTVTTQSVGKGDARRVTIIPKA